MGLEVVGHERAHQHGLRRQVHLGLDDGVLVEALLLALRGRATRGC